MTDPYEESAKAIQETAKATGKALDLVRDSGGFLSRLLREPLEAYAGMWADNVRHRRWLNQLAIFEKTKAKLTQLGHSAPIEWRDVPLRIEVGLIEAASLCEEDALQEKWANLLANFANANNDVPLERSFISVLRELSPLEAAILDKVYSCPPRSDGPAGVLTEDLPHGARREDALPGKYRDPLPEVAFAISNLVRLGCLNTGSVWDGGEYLKVTYETTFGKAFVRACSNEQT